MFYGKIRTLRKIGGARKLGIAWKGGVQEAPMQLHANMPEHTKDNTIIHASIPCTAGSSWQPMNEKDKGTNGNQRSEGMDTTTSVKELSDNEGPCPTVPNLVSGLTCACGDRDCVECGRLFPTLHSTSQQ